MHLVLTGATGMVGSATLHAMVRNPAVTHISILSRRAVPQASDTSEAAAKCTVHIHEDFSRPPTAEVLATLRGAKGVVWAQGISQTQVSAPVYEQITYDYPMTFARALGKELVASSGGDSKINFVYVSGEGATTTPGRFSQQFAVVKGRAEKDLLALSKQPELAGRLNVYSARPGGVDVKGHTEIQKYWEGRMGWFKNLAYAPLFGVSRSLYPSMVSPTRELGEALVMLATGDGKPMPEGPGVEAEGRTLRNTALRRMAGI